MDGKCCKIYDSMVNARDMVKDFSEHMGYFLTRSLWIENIASI